MNKFYKGVFLVLLAALGFGVMPIFAIYAKRCGINVNTLLVIRFTLAAVIFFSYTLVKCKGIRVTWMQLILLFVLGGVFYTAQSSLYFSSLNFIPASLAVLLLYINPVFVAIFSWIFDKEKLNIQTFTAIALSLLGLLLVVGNPDGNISYIGVLLALGASVVYSGYIVLGNRISRQLPSMLSSSFVTLFAAVSLLMIGLATDGLSFSFDVRAWLPIAGIVLFSTVLSIFTLFKGLELLGSTKASILSMGEPFFTIFLSALIFHEKMKPLQMVGGLAIIAGAVLVILSQQKVKNSVKEKGMMNTGSID